MNSQALLKELLSLYESPKAKAAILAGLIAGKGERVIDEAEQIERDWKKSRGETEAAIKSALEARDD